MFSKPYKVKSNSQLKGSERKKLRVEIINNFPTLSEDDLSVLIPPKEIIISSRVFTHSGESVIVYGVTKYPIIFEIEKRMYPTVFMMWLFPEVVPNFSTWPQVFPKIVGGADLMLPGVVLKSGPINIKSYGQLKKGDCVAVNLTSNKAAVAVGTAALASDDMYMAARRGKAVKILHHIGDLLWSLAVEKTPPELGPPDNLDLSYEELQQPPGMPSESQTKSELPHSQSSEGVSENTDHSIVQVPTLDSLHLDSEKATDSGKSETELLEDQKAEMDSTIMYSFLKAVRSLPKTVEYPLLVSTFYKVYMIPACPSHQKLDVKRSSHKKLSKFLSTMQAEGILVVRELSKGVESIVSINTSHPLVHGFMDTELPSAQGAQGPQDAQTAACPKISEMYAVTAAVLPLFSQFSYRKGALLSGPDVRKYLTIYVKDHRLQNVRDPCHVILDEVLRGSSGAPPSTVQYPWPVLIGGVTAMMTRSLHLGQFNAGIIGNLRLPSSNNGKVEPIDINVGSRSGNKKVTLVYNLELFGINLSEFAHTCQHGVAASTSISAAPNRKGQQLLIQGNQVHFVARLLQEKYEIPKRYIRGLEKAVKLKK